MPLENAWVSRQKRVRFTVWMEILEWARQFLPRVLQPGLVLRNR